MLILLLLSALLMAVPLHAASLTLNWQDNAINEDGFRVQRKIGQSGVFGILGQTATDVTTFVDPVLDGQLYCYRVNAYNGAGESPWSNEACGTTLTIPMAPTTVTIIITITTP